MPKIDVFAKITTEQIDYINKYCQKNNLLNHDGSSNISYCIRELLQYFMVANPVPPDNTLKLENPVIEKIRLEIKSQIPHISKLRKLYNKGRNSKFDIQLAIIACLKFIQLKKTNIKSKQLVDFVNSQNITNTVGHAFKTTTLASFFTSGNIYYSPFDIAKRVKLKKNIE